MALPFLDIARPGFSTKAREVLEAREVSWCAETPFGFAILRHRQAGQLLRDRRLRQGSHAWPDIVGLTGRFAEFWKASLISLEGSEHKRLRQVAQAGLAEDFILSLRDSFRRSAASLLDGLRDQSHFEFVREFSEPFAGRAITMLLGLPEEKAPALARDASTLGLAMGLDAKSHETQINAACLRLSDLASDLIETADKDAAGTSYVHRLLRAAKDIGGLDHQVLVDLVVISIFGGVDTTRAQLAFAAFLFARHPEQWTFLRAKPDGVSKAIEEVIRHYPTTTWATREALEDVVHDGIVIPKGATLHIFVHATATDPLARGTDAFDIHADRKTHFGFGGGAHHCLGQFVARTDMAAALDEMLPRWRQIRIEGTPLFLPDSGNTSPSELRVCPIWASD